MLATCNGVFYTARACEFPAALPAGSVGPFNLAQCMDYICTNNKAYGGYVPDGGLCYTYTVDDPTPTALPGSRVAFITFAGVVGA